MSKNETIAAALVAIAKAGIPTDLQELLVAGDPSKRIAPGALGRALDAGLSEEVEPWAHFSGDLPDYDHPLRCVFESGVEYTVNLLAKELGVDHFEPCDGTEEFDGDLGGTLINIVKAAGSMDEHGDYVHPRELRARAGASGGGVGSIAIERARQVEQEGWTAEHDDDHRHDVALARAAACYALAGTGGNGPFWITPLQTPQQVWPYRWEWKPKDRRSNLVRAGALIAAEIDRLDRLAMKVGTDG